MTDLIFDAPGDHVHIHSVSETGIRIGDRVFERSLIVARTEIVGDWEPQRLDDVTDADFGPLLARQPEVVLLGTGAQQQFLSPKRQMVFYRQGIGIEIMTTPAACRTFNVLASEHRDVIAALLPLA